VSDERAGSGARERRRFPLALKLSLLIAGLLALAIVSVSVYLLREEQAGLTTEMTKRGLTIAGDVASSARNPILAGDELTLSLLVHDAMKDPDLAYVILTDPGGRILAHMDSALVGTPVQRPSGLAVAPAGLEIQPYVDPQKGRLIDFAMPLTFGGVRLGVLYLGFGRQAIDQALARARNQTLLVGGGILAAGIMAAIVISAALSRPILRLSAGTGVIAAGNFDVTLPVRSRDEIGVLTESFNQMAKSLREKEMIKRAFSRYVSREVASEILKDPERAVFREERREVTVLFCDMRNFTPLSERLPPEEVVLLLNEFYTLMIDTTFKHDGTLDEFLGDAVMAVFGAPILHEDHSIRAIRTALAMQAGIAPLNASRVAAGKEPIGVGIGVSTGEAVTGSVGNEDRMEYAVIGDSVTFAARLQARAPAGQILISRRTHDQVHDLVRVRPAGVIEDPATAQPVEVFEVLGLTDGTQEG
jgi:class 3 adenylate cyclase